MEIIVKKLLERKGPAFIKAVAHVEVKGVGFFKNLEVRESDKGNLYPSLAVRRFNVEGKAISIKPFTFDNELAEKIVEAVMSKIETEDAVEVEEVEEKTKEVKKKTSKKETK